MKNKDIKLFDKRIYQRSISSGLIKKDDFQKFVGDLPDSAQNIQVVDLALLLENPIPESKAELAEDSNEPASGQTDDLN